MEPLVHQPRRSRIRSSVLGLVATVLFAAGATPLWAGVVSYSNTNSITIVSGDDPATPYPSTINVPSFAGTVTRVTVKLFGLSHSFPRNIDVLLVGPTGQTLLLMTDSGGTGPGVSGVTLTFADGASALPDTAFTSGVYAPTDNPDDDGTNDVFPGPAPTSPYGATLSVFGGLNPVGDWQLYVRDDYTASDDGSIAGGWSLTLHSVSTGPTSLMTRVRETHTATLLSDGRVLVAGGDDSGAAGSAELYEPTTGKWTPAGSLNVARSYHTATLLPNGKVLVASGATGSAELYDPASGTWSPTGSMTLGARRFHTATLLRNGKLLVAGGRGTSGALSSVELYDSATGTWRAVGSMPTPHEFHTATLLSDGRVFVTGGYQDVGTTLTSAVALYDPDTETWTAAATMAPQRSSHTATLLRDGRVLVTGGYPIPTSTSAALYDPAGDAWTATGSTGVQFRSHTSTLLPDGSVLVAGSSAARLYDPATGTFVGAGSVEAVFNHTATLLGNGRVLLAGGGQLAHPTSRSELVDASYAVVTPSDPILARSFHKIGRAHV